MKGGWMPVELTSSIDRYQSAHSAAGVPRAFAIGAPARSVRPQTFGVRPQSFGTRPQSYGPPAQTPPAHSVRPFTPRFNPGTSGAARGSDSGHTFIPENVVLSVGRPVIFGTAATIAWQGHT